MGHQFCKDGRDREGGRFVRRVRERKPTTSTRGGTDNKNDVTSLELGSENTTSEEEPERGRGVARMAAIGKSLPTIEILSSDPSSDYRPRTKKKYSKKISEKQSRAKIRNSSSWESPIAFERQSPSRSPESSHLMDYSYEEDTNSIGGRSPVAEATFKKLRWPKDAEIAQQGGIGKKSENSSARTYNELRKKNDRKANDADICLREGDEYSEQDPDGNENGVETDGEELPVLPKVPVKRKLMTEPRGAERSTQRGRPKSGTPQTKKQRTPQIDASVITQLVFGKRPPNCVSIFAPSTYMFCKSRLAISDAALCTSSKPWNAMTTTNLWH